MPHLQRLVYYSRNATTRSGEELAEEIRGILETSRRNNGRAGVSGALMFNSGCFAQILEGPRGAVEETFERIQRDPRHSGVAVLEYAPVAVRAFADWSMAFVGENERDRAMFGSLGSESGFNPAQITAEMIFQTLHRVVREEELAA